MFLLRLLNKIYLEMVSDILFLNKGFEIIWSTLSMVLNVVEQ